MVSCLAMQHVGWILMKEASKYFFDTNVIIDALANRDDNNLYARDLLRRVSVGKIKGYLCSKQICDIYYILRKYISSENERRRVIATLLNAFEILPLLKSELTYSLSLPFDDYEDAVIDEVAKINCVTAIVTSNVKDYQQSKCEVWTPKQCWDIQNLAEPF